MKKTTAKPKTPSRINPEPKDKHTTSQSKTDRSQLDEKPHPQNPSPTKIPNENPGKPRRGSYRDVLPNGYWGPNGKPFPRVSKAVRESTPEPALTSSQLRTPDQRHRKFCDASDHSLPPRHRTCSSKPKTELGVEHSISQASQGSAELSRMEEASEAVVTNEIYKEANKCMCKAFKTKVQLKQKNINDNKSFMKRVEVFLDDVKKQYPEFPLRNSGHCRITTGSYYEKVKVSQPDEFDVMVKLDVTQGDFTLEYARGEMEGFVKLKLCKNSTIWAEYLTDNGKYLSPIKIKQHFQHLLECVTESRDNIHVQEHGPAVQLTFIREDDIEAEIDVVPCVAFPHDWPQHATVEKKGIRPDRLEKIKSKGFHVVPKTYGEETLHWRVSYSLSEKELMLHEIKPKERKVLKFVKYLREKHEAKLPGLNSYHLKNVFFQEVIVEKKSRTWEDNYLLNPVIHILSTVLKALEEKKLCHFFNRKCNLLSALSKEDHLTCMSTLSEMLDSLHSYDENKIEDIIGHD